jgi:hypothetical protein
MKYSFILKFTYLKWSKMDQFCGGGQKMRGNCVCLYAINAKLFEYTESHHRCQSEKTSVKLIPVGRNPHEGGGSHKVD